ncbi:hypothetical protein JCM24511_06330 [Saitozyma sp. JCM 24511]|nr:hypothetical protein JCM24511_06330 [Saitozyma sp. JCM 24511]
MVRTLGSTCDAHELRYLRTKWDDNDIDNDNDNDADTDTDTYTDTDTDTDNGSDDKLRFSDLLSILDILATWQA